MKVRKIVAKTMPEAMKQVKEELGVEAVILNSKEITKGGVFGFFKKKQIEVVAALDPNPVKTTQKHIKSKSPVKKSIKSTLNHGAHQVNSEVLTEIKYLKKILEQQGKQDENNYEIDYQLVYEHLINQEINPDLAQNIIEKVIESHAQIENEILPKKIISDVQQEIERQLIESTLKETVHVKGEPKKIIQFVGPTGVGKTTTLAKIAANYILNDGKKVAFITADTYRIAAIEQLKTYAKILNVPVEVVYNSDDYKQALQKFLTYDVILVDTAGRNFRDKRYVEKIQENTFVDTKTYLVLSLTAKPKDVIDIYNQFTDLSINEVIFTKIDETLQYGSILNIALNHKVNVAYLTNGQDVPDDLIKPTPKKISQLILDGYFNE